MLDRFLTKGLVQLQIECTKASSPYLCCVCHQLFNMQDARVIACNSQGDRYGDICANCIAKGSSWLADRLQQQTLQPF